jgi:hypothetical protein
MTDFSDLAPIEKVQTLEYLIKEQPQIDIPVNHYFAGGVYARQMIAPANSVFTGKIHKTQHLAMLVSGTMIISGGDAYDKYTGPVMFVSNPGDKRAGIAITDCTFITFHSIEEKPIEELEKELVVDSIEEYNNYMKTLEKPVENKQIS